MTRDRVSRIEMISVITGMPLDELQKDMKYVGVAQHGKVNVGLDKIEQVYDAVQGFGRTYTETEDERAYYGPVLRELTVAHANRDYQAFVRGLDSLLGLIAEA